MKKLLKHVAAAGLTLAMPVLALAQPTNPLTGTGNGTANGYITSIGQQAGITTSRTLPQMVGTLINIVLGILGLLLLIYLIWAGFLWMTSSGDDGVKKAKSMIQNAIVGLIIITASFAISNFVISRLAQLSTGSAPSI